MNIVLDSNVIISAFFWRGNEREVLKKCKEKKIELTISPEILEEVDTVLETKFSVLDDKRADFLRNLIVISRLVFPSVEIDVIKNDPTDNRILECAVSGKADFIISGDKDLLNLGRYGSTVILNARYFLNRI
jgi:putative PIN family toxin of toxin-antitoxin system